MIDVHCHILPAVDDGVQTMEEALALIAAEVSGGTHTFIATPHVIERRDYDRLHELADRVHPAAVLGGVDRALHREVATPARRR